VVLLPLESDAACTSSNGHCARKSAVLVLVWCYKVKGDREQVLWRYWLSERCIKQWYDKPTADGCLQDLWAGGAMKQWHCCILYLGKVLYWNTRFRNILDLHHRLECPFTQQITLCFLYYFLGLRSFCLAILLLTYVVATKIWSYLELDSWHIIHTLGFITPNFLPICLIVMVAFAIFQAWICVGVDTGKCVIFFQLLSVNFLS
jgi:hypothetical protein